MINDENIRNYEVSIWTLQDSFITVLKPNNVNSNGMLQETKMELKDDGENTLSFKIPMYIKDETGDFIENPIWYNVINGNLIAGMRKIKVIFNKDKDSIFEFIITKISESHDSKMKYCYVDCAGLAFHELGHQGYEIVLSADDFNQEYENSIEEGENPPIANINYWIEKVLSNTNWDYLICMDWASQDGIIENNKEYINNISTRNEIDSKRSSQNLRSKQKIYNNPYISNWNIGEDNYLHAKEFVDDINQLERIDYVNASKSNRYNLLQKIAETFQVFCKFNYIHNKNYEIIGRQVIFYNSFIEEDNPLDFNYGYNAKKITREMDSSDIVTKMYVSELTDTGLYNGKVSLSDTLANKNLDNFLLDFDYLYNIGTISEQQYSQISSFQGKLRDINLKLNELYNQKNNCEEELSEKESRLSFLKKLLEELKEGEEENNQKKSEFKNISKYTEENPYTFFIHTDSDQKKYVSFNHDAVIIAETFKAYKSFSNNKVSEKIKKSDIDFKFSDDSKTLCTKKIILTIKDDTLNTLTKFYATFSFDPSLPYKQLEESYIKKISSTTKEIKELEGTEGHPGIIENLKEEIDNLNNGEYGIEETIQSRINLLQEFEKIMGPALREGTWQPEDKYSKYYNQKLLKLNSSLKNINQTNKVSDEVGFYWDSETFSKDDKDIELKNSYQTGVLAEEIGYYPCINISSLMGKVDFSHLYFIYRDSYYGVERVIKDNNNNNNTYYDDDDPILSKYLRIIDGEDCAFAFVKKDNEIIPIIVLLRIEKLVNFNYINSSGNEVTLTPEQQLKNKWRIREVLMPGEKNSNGEVVTEIIENKTADKTINGFNNEGNPINENLWFTTKDYKIRYPRFYVNSNRFIKTENNRILKYNSEVLNQYEDYYIKYRKGYYYITLKPSAILNKFNSGLFSFYYNTSTAAEAMYLDALDIMRENSKPKVSYTIEPYLKDKEFLRKSFEKLGQVVKINDYELKFKDVQGYISQVNLNLNKPWEDSYSIKNYKTKFEDLFTTIVASTETMKKNSQVLNSISNLLTNQGIIDPDLLQKSLEKTSFMNQYYNDILYMSALNDKATLAQSIAYKIVSGDVGLAFPNTDIINKVTLNNSEGLIIEGYNTEDNGKYGFRVTNAEMGFYQRNNEGAINQFGLYFDKQGNLSVKGIITADKGLLGGENGWVISGGKVLGDSNGNEVNGVTYKGGLIYSFNGQVILYAGYQDPNNVNNNISPQIAFYKRNSNSFEKIFSFDGENLFVKGEINAEKGYIGNSENQISIGSDNNISRIYSNNKSTLDSDTLNGFYLGTNGLALGPGVFKVDYKGELTATSVDITGKITATSGTIGEKEAPQINIGSASDNSISWIYSGEKSGKTVDKNGFYLGTDGLALGGTIKINNNIVSKFQVEPDGTLYATGATVSGVLTATSLTVGDSMTYSSSDGLKIGTEDNYLKYKDSELTIKGSINATTGTIGDLTLSNSGIYSKKDSQGRRLRLTGLSGQETPLAIGAIDTNNDGVWNWGLAPFRVSIDGTMCASNAKITGGEISINCSKDFQIYNPETDKYDITWEYRGKVSINKNFKVAEDDLYAESPCPLYIEENFDNSKSYTYLWNGQLRFASKKDGSYNTMISSYDIEAPLINTYYKAKAGAADSDSSGSINLHGNYIEIMDFSDTSELTHNTIKMTANKDNVGLYVDMKTNNDFYAQNKWLIRKNKNGEIYIDGIVHVRNSAGNWVVISG